MNELQNVINSAANIGNTAVKTVNNTLGGISNYLIPSAEAQTKPQTKLQTKPSTNTSKLVVKYKPNMALMPSNSSNSSNLINSTNNSALVMQDIQLAKGIKNIMQQSVLNSNVNTLKFNEIYKEGMKILSEQIPNVAKHMDNLDEAIKAYSNKLKEAPDPPTMETYKEITQSTRDMFPLLTTVLALGTAIFGKGNMAHKLESFQSNYASLAYAINNKNMTDYKNALQDFMVKTNEWKNTLTDIQTKMGGLMQAAIQGLDVSEKKMQLEMTIPNFSMQTMSQISAMQVATNKMQVNGLKALASLYSGAGLATIREMEAQYYATSNDYRQNLISNADKRLKIETLNSKKSDAKFQISQLEKQRIEKEKNALTPQQKANIDVEYQKREAPYQAIMEEVNKQIQKITGMTNGQ